MSKGWIVCVFVAACAKAAPQPVVSGVPAERIAYAGHGKLFDAAYGEIVLDVKVVAEIQESMLAIARRQRVVMDDQRKVAIGRAEAMMAQGELGEDEAIVLRAGIVGAYLEAAPEDVRQRYGPRNTTLTTHWLRIRPELIEELRAAVRERLEELGFFEPPPETGGTAYMDACRARGVPVPPDWAETGTAWVYQGQLTENFLGGDEYAGVWTYEDPAVRGGCIALPRGDGYGETLAGIICQSATTGHACFWDNKLRGVAPEQFIGWRGRTLRIADLKDGTNLEMACTGCHHGSNVFRLAPDDPTWAFVMRDRAATGPSFTVRIDEGVAIDEAAGGRTRYIPVTTVDPAETPRWTNEHRPDPSAGCQTCHEYRLGDPYVPRMPPRCAEARGVEGCYAP